MKKVACFGEIMMRLSTPGFQRFGQAQQFNAVYGGAEANVAISLANLGLSSSFISRLPHNDLGNTVVQELRKHGVCTEGIARGGDRLGLYFLESGAGYRASNVIYDRAHSAFAEITPGSIDWESLLAGHDWFHWSGISPAVSPNAAAVCLEGVQAAKKLGLTVSCDLNYRSKLWNYGTPPYAIMQELIQFTDVVLANPEDAFQYFGIRETQIDPDAPEHNQAVLQQLMEKFPHIQVAVSPLRRTVHASHNTWGATMLCQGQAYYSPNYDLTQMVDRVGGGDSFMAGFIYGLLQFPQNYQKALDFAVAASAVKHYIEGDSNLVKLPEVERLMQGKSAASQVSR